MIGNNTYKGFRYVPKNEGDWSKERSYESLTVVQYQGNSYTSNICVPKGIEITDTKFWTQTANYNQQFENLRDTFNATTSETIKELNDFKSKQDNEFADLLQSHKDNVNSYVDEMSKELEAEREQLQQGGLNEVNSRIDELISKPINYSDVVGINNHITYSSNLTRDIEKIKSMGVSFIRFDVYWKDIEKIKGVYDFSDVLNYINILKGKFKPYIIISGGNPIYDMAYNYLFPYTIEQKVGYINFSKALAQFLKDNNCDNAFIEVFNEPANKSQYKFNQVNPVDYVNVVKSVYTEIKNISNNYTIVSQLNGGDYWIVKCLKNNITEYCDLISLHYYTNEAPEDVIIYYNKFRYYMDKYSVSKRDIILGETGYSVTPNWNSNGVKAVVTEEERSKYIPRLILLSIAFGIDKVNLYSAYCGETDNANVEDWFGILRFDGSDTQTSTELTTLYETLKDCSFTGVHTYTKDIVILQFIDTQNNIKYIGWSTSNRTFNVNGQLISLTDRATVINILSKTISREFVPNMTVDEPFHENLLVISDTTTKTINGVTFTYDNGTIKASGTPTNNVYLDIAHFSIEANKNYILTGCPENEPFSRNLCLFTNSIQGDIFEYGGGTLINNQTNEDIKVRFFINKDYGTVDFTINPMILKEFDVSDLFVEGRAKDNNHTLKFHPIVIDNSKNGSVLTKELKINGNSMLMFMWRDNLSCISFGTDGSGVINITNTTNLIGSSSDIVTISDNKAIISVPAWSIMNVTGGLLYNPQ